MSLNRGTPRWRKATAGLAGTALAAGALSIVAVAAPAQAADPAAAGLTWSVSGQFVNHLSTHTLSGVTFDEGSEAFNFPASSVSRSGAETTYSYTGSVKGAFVAGGTEHYSVTVANPSVTVAADGSGEIVAMVSSVQNTAQGPTSPAGSTPPASVTVAEFATSSATDGVLSATPEWAGVLPTGSQQAIDLGITNPERPVDGKAFHPDFLGALMPGTRAHFHATGEDQDRKAPGEISAVTDPSIAVTVTGASAEYIDLGIKGTFFDLTKNTQPSANGVYVGVAPTGTDIFAIESGGQADGMSKFVASDHVPGSAFTDGSFTKALAVDVTKLTRGGDYTLFTWSAHGNPISGDQLYTATPIAIDWSAVPTPAVEKIRTKTKKPKTNVKKKQVVVKVKVNAAGKANAKGKVRVVVKKGKKTIFKKNVKVNKNGVAKLKLKNKKLRKLLKGKRIKGKYQVNAKYLGNKSFAAGKVAKSKFRIK